MKDASTHMISLIDRIRTHGCVLMLDFDGVLSPLIRTPSNARMLSATRKALMDCAEKFPVAIITGRPLADIEKRVGLSGVIYAGSHGMEWKIDGRTGSKKIARSDRAAFASARSALLQYARSFPKLHVEDKPHCLAMGYRSLTSARARLFCSGASRILKKFDKKIRIVDNLFTYEIMAASAWTKGDSVNFIYKKVANGEPVSVYLGDGLTDEDAFLELKEGITIRIGRSRSSAAKYFFGSRSKVDTFLRAVSKIHRTGHE